MRMCRPIPSVRYAAIFVLIGLSFVRNSTGAVVEKPPNDGAIGEKNNATSMSAIGEKNNTASMSAIGEKNNATSMSAIGEKNNATSTSAIGEKNNATSMSESNHAENRSSTASVDLGSGSSEASRSISSYFQVGAWKENAEEASFGSIVQRVFHKLTKPLANDDASQTRSKTEKARSTSWTNVVRVGNVANGWYVGESSTGTSSDKQSKSQISGSSVVKEGQTKGYYRNSVENSNAPQGGADSRNSESAGGSALGLSGQESEVIRSLISRQMKREPAGASIEEKQSKGSQSIGVSSAGILPRSNKDTGSSEVAQGGINAANPAVSHSSGTASSDQTAQTVVGSKSPHEISFISKNAVVSPTGRAKELDGTRNSGEVPEESEASHTEAGQASNTAPLVQSSAILTAATSAATETQSGSAASLESPEATNANSPVLLKSETDLQAQSLSSGNPAAQTVLDSGASVGGEETEAAPASEDVPGRASTVIGGGFSESRGDNATQLAKMVYKIAKEAGMRSLAAAPCRTTLDWMPDVVAKLEYEMPEFKFYCVDTDEPKRPTDDLVAAFAASSSASVMSVLPAATENEFPKDVELVVSWMGMQQWGVRKAWRFIKGLRRSGVKMGLFGNNPDSKNTDEDEKKVLNIRKSPMLFNEPLRVISRVGADEDDKKQLLLYSMDSIRDGF